MTPPTDRLAEIAAIPLAFAWGGNDVDARVVPLKPEDRDWLLAELARASADRDRLREFAATFAGFDCEMAPYRLGRNEYDYAHCGCIPCRARAALAGKP